MARDFGQILNIMETNFMLKRIVNLKLKQYNHNVIEQCLDLSKKSMEVNLFKVILSNVFMEFSMNLPKIKNN